MMTSVAEHQAERRPPTINGRPWLLPVDYEPFDRCELPGITFNNVQQIVNVEGIPPVLIGGGSLYPVIWLWAPEGDRDWAPLVERNVSLSALVRVEMSKTDRVVRVEVGLLTCLIIRKMGNERAAIEVFDLRPIGLDIYVEEKVLHMANMRISDTTFTNLGIAIAFD